MTEEVTQAAPVEAAVSESTPEAPKWAPEVEMEARALGWKPPEEWKGDAPPTGIIDDPARYLERAESFGPFRKLKEQNAEALRRIEAVAARQLERERQQHQATLDRIKAEKIAAVEVGDVDKYKALETREDAIRKQAPAEMAPQQAPSEEIAAIDAWRKDRPWFGKDAPDFNLLLSQKAAEVYGLAVQNGITSYKDRLAFVDSQMATAHPELYRKKAAPVENVEAGLTFGSASASSPFEKLPKDAKDAFRRFVEKGVFKDTKEDRAQYAEDYNAA